MSDASNYIKQAINDYFFRPAAQAPVRPIAHRMSLWSAVTDADAGTGTELSGNGYARATVQFGNVAIPSGVFANSLTATFATATANWVAATHYGVHDHLGNLLQSLKSLTSPQTVLAGQHGTVTAGALVVTVA